MLATTGAGRAGVLCRPVFAATATVADPELVAALDAEPWAQEHATHW